MRQMSKRKAVKLATWGNAFRYIITLQHADNGTVYFFTTNNRLHACFRPIQCGE